ncbi:MAG: hypothetical protein NUV53_03855 [Patescibacteria group bacterium]|nr:hypothetical protein [Patescibacteria group bacterium]
MKKSVLQYALFDAGLTLAYISLVSFFIANGEAIFGPGGGQFATMAFLLLFVVSAALTGLFVFGRPILWHVQGATHEGITLAIYTVVYLAIATLLALGFLFWILHSA